MSIKAGDLVVVKRPTPCCYQHKAIGRIFTVAKVAPAECHECVLCGYRSIGVSLAFTGAKINNVPTAYFVSRLTRIDPLPDSETQDNHESLTA